MIIEPNEPQAGDTRVLIVDGRMILQVRLDHSRPYGDRWVDVPSVKLGDHNMISHRGQITIHAVVEPISIHLVSTVPMPFSVPFSLTDPEAEQHVLELLNEKG